MAYLLDTNLLLRWGNTVDPHHSLAQNAVLTLGTRAETLHLTGQNLVEFRNVATRPADYNGLGWSVADTETMASTFEAIFTLLADTPDVFPTWKRLAHDSGVIGKQVHDLRLVAVCHVHGVSYILTFNTGDFHRYAGLGPGLTVVHPGSV